MATAALVLAAGRGDRLSGKGPKALVCLAGRPLVVRSLAVLASVPEIERLVPVVPAAARAEFAAVLHPSLAGQVEAVEGGSERQDSVRAGLTSLPPEFDWVAVHDAARCLVRADDVARVLAAARESGAALLAHPARDTIKRVRDGHVLETPDRSECWVAQTPQVFRRELLAEALEKAHQDRFVGTDDAQLVERLGVSVSVVLGDPGNLKITWPADLAAAEATLREEGG